MARNEERFHNSSTEANNGIPKKDTIGAPVGYGRRDTSDLARRAYGKPTLMDDRSTHDFFEDPFGMMRRFAQTMDSFFEDFGGRGLSTFRGNPSRMANNSHRELWNPTMETFEREDAWVVKTDLPGVKRDNIDIEVEENRLTIRGERRHELEDKDSANWRSEHAYGRFMRVLTLPKGTNEDDITASYEDGVLEIEVRKPEDENKIRKARKITVQ